MRFAEVIKLLAAPFPIQEAFLRDLPENAAVPGFTMRNDIYRMALLYLESVSVQEGPGGTEALERWHARTQIPRDLALRPRPIEWLSTALRMLVELDKPFLYTRHGLRSAYEWRLIRHLAEEVCETMGWSRDLQYTDFQRLWNELGDGVIAWKESSQEPA
jgi:hypothetical protein